MNKKSQLLFFTALILIVSICGLLFVFQSWMPFMWGLLALSLIGIGVGIYLERQNLWDFATMKTTQRGLNMGVVIALVLVILVTINYLGVKYSRTYDFSLADQYSLSEQTKKVLDHLDSDLELKYFYQDGLQNQDQLKKSFANLVKLYQDYNSKVQFENVELNSKPKIVEEYGAKQGTGEAFLKYKGKINKIDTQFGAAGGQVFSEQELTNAIIKSTRQTQKSICFLAGHGERSLENDKDEKALTAFRTLLEKRSFQIESLNLFQTGNIPEACSVLVIAGATTELQKNEVSLVTNYINAGKPTLILLDRGTPQSLQTILKNAGLALQNVYVFNILNTPQGPIISTDQPTVATQFSLESEISLPLAQNRQAIFIRPDTLIEVQGFEGILTPLVKTADATVALKTLNTSEYEGKPQSFALGYQVSGPQNMVIFSDVNFVSNQAVLQSSNKDLIFNSISFLANEKDLISLIPKDISKTPLKVNGPVLANYFKYLVVGVLIPIPFLFLIISLIMWFRKRNA